MVRQLRDILPTLAQRRQRHHRDIQPIVEIFAKAALADCLGQVDVSGGNHPDIHFNRFARADAGNFALLQHP